MNGKGMMKGSMTVEMVMIVPLVMILVMGCILAVFYYHDKNIISGAAYESAVVGSNKARQKEGAKEGEVAQLFSERVGSKCILFSVPQAEVEVTKEAVTVKVQAAKGRVILSVVKRAKITEPEKFIRDMRRIKTK